MVGGEMRVSGNSDFTFDNRTPFVTITACPTIVEPTSSNAATPLTSDQAQISSKGSPLTSVNLSAESTRIQAFSKLLTGHGTSRSSLTSTSPQQAAQTSYAPSCATQSKPCWTRPQNPTCGSSPMSHRTHSAHTQDQTWWQGGKTQSSVHPCQK